mgnify:CR=1 FL=1
MINYLKKKKEKSAQVSVPETVKTVSPETEDAILETLLQHIGGKWKIRIIWALQNAQSKRYSTLKNEVSSITDMMLSQSLKDLCADGLLHRQQYQEIPPKVEYSLTPSGKTLLPALNALCEWERQMELSNHS